MGQGPDLKTVIDDSHVAKTAVNAAVEKAHADLANTQAAAQQYINEHTKGLIEIVSLSNKTYSKFSSEYSLDALNVVVDNLIDLAKSYLDEGDGKSKAAEMAGDIGEVVKSTLSLAATSSSTTQDLQLVYNNILAEDENFAMYYACNSTTVKGENAWGDNEITVVSNMYLLARVQPNPEVTYAKILQQDLDLLVELNKRYAQAILDAKTMEELDNLIIYEMKLELLRDKISKQLEEALAAELKEELSTLDTLSKQYNKALTEAKPDAELNKLALRLEKMKVSTERTKRQLSREFPSGA